MRFRMCFVVILVAFAGCSGFIGNDLPSEDVNDESNSNMKAASNQSWSDHRFAFQEISDNTGFNYESIRMGVNGNDGIYVTDYNNDLHSDILAIGGRDPVLFENIDGEFKQKDVLPAVSGHIQGALFIDYNNNGWEDLLLLRRGDTPIFLENQEGEFHEIDVGLNREFVVPVSASAADYTGNGCLDLFIVDYNDWTAEPPAGWEHEIVEKDNGNPNALFQGDCNEFTLDENNGINGEHWSLATSFVDLNNNGYPDIHVANDYYNDVIYYNNGNGTFAQEYLENETDRNGMSSRAVDITGNGHLDIFVTNIYFPRNRFDEVPESDRQRLLDLANNRLGDRMKGNNLLVGTDDGFKYEGQKRNVSDGGWGWAAAIEDFDSDGKPDILHATLAEQRFSGDYPRYTRPMLFAQEEDEFLRQNASAVGFNESDDRGLASLDYDHSGSMDAAVAANQQDYRLYRNDGTQGESLQVIVKAPDLGHTSLGTRVEATVNGETHLRIKNAKADYQTQHTRTLHFGLDNADQVDELYLKWPDGTELTLNDIETGQRLLITPDGIQERIEYEYQK